MKSPDLKYKINSLKRLKKYQTALKLAEEVKYFLELSGHFWVPMSLSLFQFYFQLEDETQSLLEKTEINLKLGNNEQAAILIAELR